MLQFAVYDQHGPAKHWPLVGAHLVGPDEAPMRGRVSFRDGRIVADKQVTHAVGLALLYHAGPAGELILQTCLLPDRPEPYLLSLELARHRIKMFIVKSEEWQMFDLSADHPAPRLWEEARHLFTEAINMSDLVKADQAARASLIHGIDATERLAMAHAEILLHRRYSARPASSTTLGTRVWPARDAQPLKDILASEFDLISLPIRWRDIEAEEGRYNWQPLDRWMNWAHSQGKPVIAGPLLDFSKKAIPEWMYVWQHDYETCRDLAYDYAEKVVQRYKGAVGIWNIASGLNVNDNFVFKPQQLLDLTRMASLLVRQSHKRARVMLELAQTFGEHAATNPESVLPFAFLEQVVQEGIRLDCVGVQLLLGQKRAGQYCRDLMQVSSLLDRFFLLELPVLVTAVGVPSEPPGDAGGWCYEGWSAEVQSRWAGRMLAVALSKPFIETVIWSDLYDHAHADLPGAGLITDAGRSKPALSRLVGMRRRLRKPLGQLSLKAKASTEAEG